MYVLFFQNLQVQNKQIPCPQKQRYCFNIGIKSKKSNKSLTQNSKFQTPQIHMFQFLHCRFLEPKTKTKTKKLPFCWQKPVFTKNTAGKNLVLLNMTECGVMQKCVQLNGHLYQGRTMGFWRPGQEVESAPLLPDFFFTKKFPKWLNQN